MGLKVAKDYLTGKRVLIVDDEEDVLDSLEDLLTMCKVMKASSFEEAKNLLMNEKFHLAILDIMGVDSYELLKIANERDVIAVMLTARALSVEDTKKSFKEGAASYLPKDKLAETATFLNDALEAQIKGESFWWRWYFNLGPYYDKKFGSDWQDEDRSFWNKFREFAGIEYTRKLHNYLCDQVVSRKRNTTVIMNSKYISSFTKKSVLSRRKPA